MSMISRLAIVAAALLLASCSGRQSTMPTTESRQSGPWPQNATVITTGKHTIYYYGTARPDSTSAQGRWSGAIDGDIYVTSTDGRTLMIPEGTLIVSSTDTLRVLGASRTPFTDKTDH
jgi:hypothetical protein